MSRNDDRVTFNITYYPVFKNIRIVLEELHILLAPDEQHRNVFTDIPRIGFKNGKSLKDHLIRSVLLKIDVADNFGPCSGKRPPCELCKLMKKTSTFKKRNSDETYHIHQALNCNSKIQYILKNVINVGNNALVVLKLSFVIGLTIIKVLPVNLRTKNKFPKKL